jgi:hypothetical protein
MRYVVPPGTTSGENELRAEFHVILESMNRKIQPSPGGDFVIALNSTAVETAVYFHTSLQDWTLVPAASGILATAYRTGNTERPNNHPHPFSGEALTLRQTPIAIRGNC